MPPPRPPTASPATTTASLPTTSPGSAHAATTPPAGSRPPSTTPPPRPPTASPATPTASLPITLPGSARLPQHQDWKQATFNHAAGRGHRLPGLPHRQPPGQSFPGQCSSCHTTSAWKPATFAHAFPMNHGNANGRCAACHTNGGSGPANCFLCHNKPELDKKHITEMKITNYASRCLECHNGKD